MFSLEFNYLFKNEGRIEAFWGMLNFKQLFLFIFQEVIEGYVY